MRSVLIGIAGFLLLMGVGWAGLRGWTLLKRSLTLIGGGIATAAQVLLILDSPLLAVPLPVRIAGGMLAVAAALLLLQSLVFEMPRGGGYLAHGAAGSLVTTGTYALARHPGVLWFAAWLAGLLGASGARDLLAALPLWAGMNALYAWIEDRYYFPRMFGPPYAAYQRLVPMLVPNRESIRRCAATFRLFRQGVVRGEPGPGP